MGGKLNAEPEETAADTTKAEGKKEASVYNRRFKKDGGAEKV